MTRADRRLLAEERMRAAFRGVPEASRWDVDEGDLGHLRAEMSRGILALRWVDAEGRPLDLSGERDHD